MKKYTQKDKDAAINLRKVGYGYKTISKKLNIPTSSLVDWVKKIPANNASKLFYEENIINVDLSTCKNDTRKKVLVHERGRKCEVCLLEIWLKKPITLELEHIDGDIKNNDRKNLKLLCPNCHSYTPTWRGRNINKGKRKVSNKELMDSLKNSISIKQALENVGLTPKGGNYKRVKNLI